MQEASDADAHFMRLAINASKAGYPAPNPHVGCVIVQDGKVAGAGYHDHAGGPHAEVNALRAAQGRTHGATAYVTLEPCNHHGRTPPCTEGLIAAGVTRVVIACKDPNPRAAGGAARLEAAGLQVISGILEDQAASVNRQFLFAMKNRRPLVVVKAAISLDGRIALPDGTSKWITSKSSRMAGQRLRAELGSVLVGRRTVSLDDPQLTARVNGVVNQPVRIVLDPSRRLKGKERVFDDSAETIWITGSQFAGSNGEILLRPMLRDLFQRGITGVLVEGGGTTIGHFFEEGLVDRLELFVAPKVLGSGLGWIQGVVVKDLESATFGRMTRHRRLGEDLWITVEQPWEPKPG